MIQPLRNVHRRAFLALAFILPAILVIGLMVRHCPVQVTADTVDATESTRASKVSLRWRKHSIDTYFYSNPGNEKVTAVVLNPQRPIDQPDLLLYWVSADASAAGLSQAQLLGPFVPGKSYSLPAGERHGELLLYSLAHRQLVDAAKIEGLP